MINWKGCGSNRPWPSLRYYPGIRLDGLRKTTKTFNQNSRSPDRYQEKPFLSFNFAFGLRAKNNSQQMIGE
jgi:hypothetical protein